MSTLLCSGTLLLLDLTVNLRRGNSLISYVFVAALRDSREDWQSASRSCPPPSEGLSVRTYPSLKIVRRSPNHAFEIDDKWFP